MDMLIQLTHAPGDGETVQANSISYVPGGKGANQATSCARQGAKVSMMGCVGADAYGTQLREGLSREGIDTTGVVVDPVVATGVAVVMVDERGQNRIVCVAGANHQLQLDQAQLGQSLSAAQFLIAQLEVPLAQVVQVAQLARRAGCKLILNPSPPQPLPNELWPLIDTLILNETEAQALTGLAVVDGPASAVQAARVLRARGVHRVVVTLGAQGAVAVDDQGSTQHPAPVVRVVDSTAAGDTFLGAVAVALAQGQSLAHSVAWGIRCATLCVQTLGAQPSIPQRAQVMQSPPVPPWTSL